MDLGENPPIQDGSGQGIGGSRRDVQAGLPKTAPRFFSCLKDNGWADEEELLNHLAKLKKQAA